MNTARGAGRATLAADRERAAGRLVTLANQALEGLVREDGGLCLTGLRQRTLELVDRIGMLDRRLAEGSVPGPTDELLAAGRTIAVLAEALQMLPAGSSLEVVRLLRGGLAKELVRLQRARRWLDQQLR